ncbi:MAG: GNAT family N-acetyltransferase [Roseburia sp.]|nr:GNAT family N-acetyltransferase [Roseburia sp.]
MVYYSDNRITIRNMEPSDVAAIVAEEVAQGWEGVTTEKYEMRLRHQAEGRVVALIAECHENDRSNIAGYVNVYRTAPGGAFRNKGVPEIKDFGVLIKYRNRGIGTKLMDVAEQIAAEYSDTVCIGVGLHSGYGSAQRMYVKRGYIPDGSGVWFRDSVCREYEDCCNDDDLVLWFSKKLSERVGALRHVTGNQDKRIDR